MPRVEVRLPRMHHLPPLRATGVRHEDVVGFCWSHDQHGQHLTHVSFLLTSDGMMLTRPTDSFKGEGAQWYCDLVSISGDDPVIVRDLYVDIIVGLPTEPYRVLDLDEYADAVAAGDLTLAEGLDGLRRTQAFLDRCLNSPHKEVSQWPDFPPRAVAELLARNELPQDWSWS
jgi:Protein of unknown function (DUF402)